MTDPVAAFYFHPDQVEGEGRDLVGRRSAGESFLKGYLRHMPGDAIGALTESPAAAKALSAKAAALGATRPLRILGLRGGEDFTRFGTIFFPTPGYQKAAWRRLRFGPERCSLVGITHTVSTRRVMEAMHNLMIEPVEDWDAIICTSRAVRSVVARQMELEEEYLRRRFAAARVPRPQLPLIPLGIETADFAPLPGARARMRADRGAGPEDVVVLTVGRLSVVEKANPLPLFLALEMVARATGRRLHLWMTGWASRPEEMALHEEGAKAICTSVTVRFLDGRDPDIRRNVWAGADIFTLPADSLQETFGLVPVEAMAAGLPVVMPDWDGFRDTVPHGRAGFRIPTRMPGPGPGEQMARRFADETDGYMQYLCLAQSAVQIDVPLYAAAIGRLATDADLRRRMGAEAARHARTTYDWAAVIPLYRDLAAELADRRRSAAVSTPPLASGPLSPIEVDPFDLYRDYPTATLDPDETVQPGLAASGALLDLIDRISGRQLYRRAPLPRPLLQRVIAAVAKAGRTTPRALAAALGEPPAVIALAVLHLAKGDLVRLGPIRPREPPAPPEDV